MPVNSFDSYPLTWKPEKETLCRPYFQSLAEDLEKKIKSGILMPGTKLPPQREIADYLDLNYTTITRVYEICKKKGLVYGVMGKGTFVSPHSAEDITITIPNTAGDCIELGAINGFSENSELVERATRDVIEKGYLRKLYDYSNPLGQPHQLIAGIRWMEQLGAHTDLEHIAILSGAQNALTVALVSLFSPGDKIAVDTFTYPNLIELAKLLHIVLVPIEGDRGGMKPEELRKQCAAQKIKGVYLIPAYANPTAITLSFQRREQLARAIRENGLILIEDDISSWMLAAEKAVLPSLFELLEGDAIYICGMTKNLCPGLRIAYMAYGERFRKAICHGIFNTNIKTSSLDAEIIAELILNGDAYRIAAQKRAQAEKNCRLFETYFAAADAGSEPAGYYRWMPIYIKKTAAEIEGELLARGVRVYHSKRFTVSRNEEQQFLRVALCSAGSTKRLKKGLRILKAYLEENE